MALNTAQKALLDAWSKTQAGWSQGQVDGDPAHDLVLGTSLANGTLLDDIHRDVTAQSSVMVGAPGVGPNIDMAVFTALAPGRIVSSYISISGEAMATTSTTGSTYTVVTRRFSPTPLSLTVPVSLLTGVTADVPLRLPTGAQASLLTSGKHYSITASATAIAINVASVTSSFANTANVGDWLSVAAAAAPMLGASNVNAGLYLVTASSATQVTAVKQNLVTAPAHFVTATAVAGDVTAYQIVRAAEATFAAGDVLGVRIAVPAVSAASSVTAIWTAHLRVRYNP